MRKLTAAFLAAGAVFAAAPALAADMPFYPPVIDVPDVDYGVSGSFYLRGSAAGNALWSKEAYAWDCTACGATQISVPITAWGYGYSVGAGFGYETGTGLRFDATVDLVNNSGLTATLPASSGWRAGDYKTTLRSTIALANAYYDFSFGGSYGAGVGAAFNDISVDGPIGGPTVPSGQNTSLAAAGMVGVGYDFGTIVADVGYRGLYINKISNSAAPPDTAWTDNNWLHEVRGTVRYRFN
jgi:hypothetical protein